MIVMLLGTVRLLVVCNKWSMQQLVSLVVISQQKFIIKSICSSSSSLFYSLQETVDFLFSRNHFSTLLH